MKFTIIGKGVPIIFYKVGDFLEYLEYLNFSADEIYSVYRLCENVKNKNVKSWTRNINNYKLRIERNDK